MIDFVCSGINQPLKSKLMLEGPCSPLSDFMDYALLTVVSVFTAGVAEERDTAVTHVMAAALEHEHKMAATTGNHPIAKWPSQMIFMRQAKSQLIFTSLAKSQLVITSQVNRQLIFMNQVKSQLIVMSQVTTDLHELSQATVDFHESSQVTVDCQESSQVTVDLHESSQVTADYPVTSHLH